jgi:hypothetical protein
MKHKRSLRFLAAIGLFFVILLTPISTHADIVCPGGGAAATPAACGTVNTGSGSTAEGSGSCGETAALADGGVCGSQVSDDAASKDGSSDPDLVKKYLNPAINLFSALVGVVVVMSIIIGGIQYSSSAGDPQKAAKAKGRILNAIIAILAYAFLYGFLQFIIPGGAFQ